MINTPIVFICFNRPSITKKTFNQIKKLKPKKLFLIKGNQVEIQYLRMCDDEIESDFEEIRSITPITHYPLSININQRISKDNYILKVSKMLEHIQRGDIYEANFCMEFYAENAKINPLEMYHKLNTISEAPFAVYFKNAAHYLLSASPERYLRKEGTRLISQPIKGTSKRSADESFFPIFGNSTTVIAWGIKKAILATSIPTV